MGLLDIFKKKSADETEKINKGFYRITMDISENFTDSITQVDDDFLELVKLYPNHSFVFENEAFKIKISVK